MDERTTLVLIVAVVVVALVLLAVAVRLLLRLVRTRRALRRAGLPAGPKWVFWGAVAYLVLPADLVPDPVYLDDIGALLLALRTMGAALPKGVRLSKSSREPVKGGVGEPVRGGSRAPGHLTARPQED
ncbi:YkvA family protein [Streptomyces abyssomicinicus]|uniref:YkvA family protein n=1 Tax=Streptomyces abyssomicinicus TaxID=574929 RepID=UPI00124FE646|nr:YkvA family protein [Streptomyces abyssomicinicus]